jgi:cation diffusion facilitator CzcD-associated flavoprotein CzcO
MGSFGLPPDLQIGSNTPGPHPASISRPLHYPEWDAPSAGGYRVSDHMLNEPPPGKPFKIIMMGAGAAGIDFLHHAPPALKGLGVDIACYDKNPEVGGTWYENRYPGCACDVPSASYSFSWRPNPDWTSYYSGAREIWEYFRDIVEDEGLMKYITLSTEVKKAVWDEKKSKWVLSLSGTGDEGKKKEWDEECDLFLNGTGFLNAWKWPSISGFETFQGRMFHTARYEEGFDLKGKRVAVIGSGSSGVQTVSSIYPHVSKLYTWVRSPTWITAGFAQKFAGPGGANFDCELAVPIFALFMLT